MGTPPDSHSRMTMITAAISLIAAGLGAMYILLYFGLPQDWFVLLAPISTIVIAGVFLYHGRDKFKSPPTPDLSGLDLQSPVIAPDAPQRSPVIAPDSPLLQSPAIAPDAPLLQSPAIAPDAPLLQSPAIAPDAPLLQSPAIAPDAPLLQSPAIAPEAPQQSPVTAVNKLMQELESKIEQQGMIVSTDTAAGVITKVTPQEASVVYVDKSMQQIEKKRELRCIIIAAASHGVLQDRLNNWLSGGYGLVVSTSMAVNAKGFYLTVFYESLDKEQE